ncbi:hypothetical protein [Haliangium sp.]
MQREALDALRCAAGLSSDVQALELIDAVRGQGLFEPLCRLFTAPP